MFIPQQVPSSSSSLSIICGQDESVFKTHVVNTIQSNFTDLMLYLDDLLLPAVDNVLRRPPHSLHINPKQILLNNGINKLHFDNSKEQKKILDTVRIALGCCYVLLHEKRMKEKLGHLEFTRQYEMSEEVFLMKYQQDRKFREVFYLPQNSVSQLSTMDKKDLKYMIQFCKYIRLALELLPGYRNKGLAIQIAGRLEGSKEVYVFGSGQRDTSTRREVIYHMESGTSFPIKGSKESNETEKVTKRKSSKSAIVATKENDHNANNKRTRSPSVSSESSDGADSCRHTSKVPTFEHDKSLFLDDFGLASQAVCCPSVSSVPLDFEHVDSVTFNFDDIDFSSFDDVLNITNPAAFYPV
jgi:hypothetical protein